MQCLECQSENPDGAKFCNECVSKLTSRSKVSIKKTELESHSHHPPRQLKLTEADLIAGERKHVTVLFSDLAVYTTMSEKLDPEDVKEITSRIFGDIAKIGYACAWLPFTCAELGCFAEGSDYGNRAQKVAELFPSDQYLFFNSVAGVCVNRCFMGDARKVFEGRNSIPSDQKNRPSQKMHLGSY